MPEKTEVPSKALMMCLFLVVDDSIYPSTRKPKQQRRSDKHGLKLIHFSLAAIKCDSADFALLQPRNNGGAMW